MKLEVAEDTLIGSRNAVSIAGTFNTPLPMPRIAETSHAPYINSIPRCTCCTR